MIMNETSSRSEAMTDHILNGANQSNGSQIDFDSS